MVAPANCFCAFFCSVTLITLGATYVPEAHASQYFFSLQGNDQTGNGSQASPWRSINKFNTLELGPGDGVFFRAGDVFSGSMELDEEDTGTNSSGQLIAPITITSYGGGPLDRATIRSASNKQALLSYNNGGISLSNLEFANGGTYQSNPASGIEFRTDYDSGSGYSQLSYIHLDNVVSHGFHQSGLSLDASGSVGYQDVQISNSQFYDNQFAGVDIGASQYLDLIHRDVKIENVIARNNPGYAGCSPHCGHGIVIGQVDNAVIENSIAYSNGLVAGKGNIGIWSWQSNNVTIQHNTAYGNRSPSGADGGGFDIDGGVTNSVVQYNKSYDNAGAGYLLAEFAYAGPMSQNVFRYNLSVNDGNDGYGAITVSGGDPTFTASSALFHNNTAVVDHNVAPASRGPVWFLDGYHSDLNLTDNVFVALNGTSLIDGDAPTNTSKFIHNMYWTNGAPVQLGGATYASVPDWAAASQQEMLDGQYVGVQANPNFSADGLSRPIPPSLLIDAGLPADSTAWPSWFAGIGPTDFYGTVLPQALGPDIGAVEYYLIGDYNRDGYVDAADYILWRKSSGQTGAGLAADGNHDGIVDASDYGLWRTHVGDSIGAGAGFASGALGYGNVPEPSPSLLLLLAIVSGYLMNWRAVTDIRPSRKQIGLVQGIVQSRGHR
jgi:Right handed beta helix region